MHGDPPASLDGAARLILVVEDEFLIAMELTEVLEEGGFRVLGPVSTVMAARLASPLTSAESIGGNPCHTQ